MDIKSIFLASLMLMMPLVANADIIQITQGTAGDANKLPVTSASPALSDNITFAGLLSNTDIANCNNNYPTGCPTFNPSTYASQGVTISSPDGLLAIPFSTQTAGGNELLDEGTNGDFDGTANIFINLANPVNQIGVGLAEFDAPISLTIEALGAGNTVLGVLDVSSAVMAAESAVNTGNTYFLATDTTTAGIYGLEILQTTQTQGSGLALAEVEFAPEPSTFLMLLIGGLAVIGSTRFRRNA